VYKDDNCLWDKRILMTLMVKAQPPKETALKPSLPISAFSLPALLIAAFATIGSAADAKPASDAKVTTPYTLDTCIVSGDKFGGDMGDPIVKVYNGREVKFCCEDCIPKYGKSPDKYNKMIDKAAQAKPADKGRDDKGAHDDHHDHK